MKLYTGANSAASKDVNILSKIQKDIYTRHLPTGVSLQNLMKVIAEKFRESWHSQSSDVVLSMRADERTRHVTSVAQGVVKALIRERGKNAEVNIDTVSRNTALMNSFVK